jgi:hypothetical protein
MKFMSLKAHAMSLQIPFLTLLMLALAASTLLVVKHETSQTRPSYAMAAGPTRRESIASGAARRPLLF